MSDAADEVVVDEPGSLHQGMANRRADEREARFLRSLLIASDNPVRAGISSRLRHAFLTVPVAPGIPGDRDDHDGILRGVYAPVRVGQRRQRTGVRRQAVACLAPI